MLFVEEALLDRAVNTQDQYLGIYPQFNKSMSKPICRVEPPKSYFLLTTRLGFKDATEFLFHGFEKQKGLIYILYIPVNYKIEWNK